MIRIVVVTAACVGLLGCGEVRPPTPSRPALTPTYLGEVQPLLAQRCVSCHGRQKQAGQYALHSYVGLLGPGTDEVRNAIAGDASSVLLTKLDAAQDPEHWSYLLPPAREGEAAGARESQRDADLALLRTWVVENRLAYFDVLVHPPSWVYPGDRSSKDFHGGALRAAAWDYAGCRECHGKDLRGGSSGKSCAVCHAGGAESCTTCHGSADRDGPGSAAPPTDLSWNLSHTARGVGAHQVHLRSRTWWAEIACQDCHRVPTSVGEAGHLDADLKAELTWGSRSSLLGVRPSYDESTGSCSVYCHGAAFTAIGQGSKPPWISTGTAQCGSCHKVPAVAGGPYCNTCHQQSVTECTPGTDPACLETAPGVGTRFVSAAFHGDGKYVLGKAGVEGTCYACHGTKDSGGAPAPDLRGRTGIKEVTVGLHSRHLTDNAYRKALPCGSCHVVPTDIRDKGHFDSDLPAEVVWGPLSTGALRGPGIDRKPEWDRTKATCTNVYCHSLDSAAATEWKWTEETPLSCSSCHGLPPAKTVAGGIHPSTSNCPLCHASAYVDGNLDPSKHINGKVDL